MALLASDWGELRRLLLLVKQGKLTSPDEQKLRYLVWKENPAAFQMDLGGVLDAGFFLIGLHKVEEEIRLAEAANATAYALR